MVKLFFTTIRLILKYLDFVYNFLKSLFLSIFLRKKYKTIKFFVMFIGYPRSGHSLIAASLDAHPNIVISMEWDVLTHIRFGYNRLQVFYSITRNSEKFKKEKHNVWTNYSYKINNWQGSYSKLYIIGDKLAGKTTLMLAENLQILELINNRIKLPVKYIHVIRNPFDIITTMTKRYCERQKKTKTIETIDLLPFIKYFFERVKVVDKLKKNKKKLIYDLYHEDFIAQPEKELKNLLKYLDVKFDEKYLKDCKKIVYKETNKSRLDIEWDIGLIKYVEELISKYDFLKRYSFTDQINKY